MHPEKRHAPHANKIAGAVYALTIFALGHYGRLNYSDPLTKWCLAIGTVIFLLLGYDDLRETCRIWDDSMKQEDEDEFDRMDSRNILWFTLFVGACTAIMLGVTLFRIFLRD